jgi:FkbH-like protein/FkbM family methyltransferase
MNNIFKRHSDQSQILHPLLGHQLPSALNEIQFESQISIDLPAFLTHHRVYNTPILPATAYVEMALAAGSAVFKSETWVVEDVVIQQALILPEDEVQTVQLILTHEGTKAFSFQIFSLTTDKENEEAFRTLHAFGKILVKAQDPEPPQADLVTLQAQCIEEISIAAYYQQCRERGINYGSSFQVIEQLWGHEGEAIGQIRLPETLALEAGDYRLHPVLLDACFQVLWATFPESVKEQTYLPVGIERLQVYRRPGIRLWSHARLHPANGLTQQTLTAELRLFDESGALVIEVERVFVKRSSRELLLRDLQKKQTIAIAATFTAEPVEESIAFWMQALDIPSQIEFAPYNQVFQQLLAPSSLFASNVRGVNVVLVRFEDWDKTNKSLLPVVNLSEKERILAGQLRYTLPNRLEIAHLNRYETEYLYQEIFVDRVYLKHGIVFHDGDCIFDVGANIGLFTLFMQQKLPNASIYSFEPAPHAFEILRRNSALYCKNANVFNCGLGDENKEAPFTFYPRSSVFSSYQADTAQDEKAIRAVILNTLQQKNVVEEEVLGTFADELLAGRLEQETVMGQLRTLSSVIREHHIEKIDLLKLDAEKSELAVLKGIEDNDWQIIKQIVVEVHDQEGSVIAEVTRLLKDNGFELIVDEENLLKGSGLYNVYAVRSTQQQNLSPKESVPDVANIEQNVRNLGLALRSAAARSATPHLVYICPASPTAVADAGHSTLYQEMEDLLDSELDGVKGAYLVKTSELTATYPIANYYDPYGEEYGHIPYTPTFFTALGTAIARKIHVIESEPYKVVVLDADGTLWKGVCGEDGPFGVEIDSAYEALQEFMVRQHNAGMLICLCSKNNEEDVFAVFKHRPEMPLKREQLSFWRINWRPKSENIKFLADELKLGLDSFIFIDDNPIECAEVQANCPEVLTLQLPPDPSHIPQLLNHIWAFDRLKLTEEDKKRATLYKQNVERESFRKQTLSFADFLADLGLDVKISPMAAHHLARVSQLTQRTNQFNLTTFRRSESEIQQFYEAGKFEVLVVEVSDRFGDYGIVGALMFKAGVDAIKLDTFLLSCRALGRGIEHQMLAKLGEIAKERGLSSVKVPYVPTQKNQPALDFLVSVSTQFKQRLGEGWLFEFPVEYAAKLTYSPSASVMELPPSSDLAVKEPVSGLAPRTANKSNRKKRVLTINRIGTELYDAETVFKVIESQRRRVRPQLKEAFVAPRNSIEAVLAEIVAKVLKLEQVGIYDNFLNLGLDSLMAIQLKNRVTTDLRVDVPTVIFMESASVSSVATQVSQQLALKTQCTSSASLLKDADATIATQKAHEADQIAPSRETYAHSVGGHLPLTAIVDSNWIEGEL